MPICLPATDLQTLPPALEGIKLNDAGSLAYVGVFFSIPITGSTFSQNFVDIYDVEHHEIRERVLLSEKFLPQEAAQNALAIDPTGQDIYVLTASGLAIVTLDSVPLSIGSVPPNSGAGGTLITIRGSGFTQQTTATCNGIAATVTFVDADTLHLVLPTSLASGPVQIAFPRCACLEHPERESARLLQWPETIDPPHLEHWTCSRQ